MPHFSRPAPGSSSCSEKYRVYVSLPFARMGSLSIDMYADLLDSRRATRSRAGYGSDTWENTKARALNTSKTSVVP
jgi:hypothetical protein